MAIIKKEKKKRKEKIFCHFHLQPLDIILTIYVNFIYGC